jgi:replication-associated recombination protein RarA
VTFKFSAVLTVGGYSMDEVASSLQKCIRRSDLDGALFWASELDLSGYGEYAFKRLRIICSEDIGIADRSLPATLEALYRAWSDLRKKRDPNCPERLPLVHAVILLATAPKSRLADHAAVVFYRGDRPKRPIEDFAKDRHTQAGRALGRAWSHFWTEGSKLIPESEVSDPYREQAMAILRDESGLFDHE